MRPLRPVSGIVALSMILLQAAGGVAQAPGDPRAWDGDRALELIRSAQARRAEAAVDTSLVSYQARALGRVYFYLDREDTSERNLVKTDQLALDVIWQAPDLVKQRIVGWRDERSLPTNIHYHLDHLSVVQENFGDEIRIGDGDEVRGVVHPAAPAAERFYEYRLADSLTLALPGAEEPVRVYRVDVRPRDPSRPAFVGSVYVERRRGDIVRMDFTFTPSAYVDRYLDYINISLDNGLWRGRHWLPNEQRVELRRRIPQLDIPAGSVIRANMRIGEYVFNEELPISTFAGPPVVAAPREEREAFPFDEPIDAELREEGLGPAVELDEIRRQARRLVRDRALGRLSGLRPGVERVSDVVRYNRAEGLALGLGGRARPAPAIRLSAAAGYAFAAGHTFGWAGVEVGERTTVALEGYFNRVADIGIAPAASGAMSSLSALLAARDYLDPYYASGVAARVERPLRSNVAVTGGLRLERHGSAGREADYSVFGGTFREARPIDPVRRLARADLSVARRRPAETAEGWTGTLRLGLGRDLGDGATAWAEPRGEAGYVRRWSPAAAAVELETSAGAILGDAPSQLRYLLGGRGTVPGFTFRSLGGDRFALARVVGSGDITAPWVRGRALGAIGWIDGDAPEPGATRASIGLGVGLLYDVLRIDLVRGLGDEGRWELVIDTRTAFWDFL
jgi:hypothetical protein